MAKEIDIKTEQYSLSDHNPNWSKSFDEEKKYLQAILPKNVIGKIEHIGSTAINGIKAKPIIDILMEVSSQADAREIIAPILEKEGYEHIIHNGIKEDEPPESSWFIKRDINGERTHHIWCAEKESAVRNRVLFARYLNEHPEKAKEYENLKLSLLQKYPGDRRKYLE